MALVISRERPEFANWMLSEERKILVELLNEAERRGEFFSDDKEFTAEMVQSATMKFRYPQLWSKLTLPKLERELEGRHQASDQWALSGRVRQGPAGRRGLKLPPLLSAAMRP